jgi:protein-tyrosine phosphatase
MKQVLFLCSGNYYRSRFCEIYFNWLAEQRELWWRAESRGLRLNPKNIGSISGHTVARLSHHGIPTNACQRLPMVVSHQDFDSADHIVAVKEAEHRPLIQGHFSSWLDRVEFWEVHDVDYAAPDEAMPQLEREVIGLMERLALGERKAS